MKANLLQAQSPTQSLLTELEAEVKENKRLLLEQKKYSAKQASQQAVLQSDVAALRCQLDELTRMLHDNWGGESNSTLSGTTVSLLSWPSKNC